MAASDDALDQLVESLARKTGTFDHAVALLWLRKAGDRGIHMVVEREQVDSSVGKPLGDLGLGIEIVGLVAVEAGVGRQFRPQDLDIFEQLAGIIGAAQAGLPRPGRGMKDRGDAVCDRLPVAVDQRHIDGKIDAGTGHHLPLEGVAMQVDNTWQHLQAACVDAGRTSFRRRIHRDDVAPCDAQRDFNKLSANQRLAAFD